MTTPHLIVALFLLPLAGFVTPSDAATPSVLVVVHARDSASKRAAQYMSSGLREAYAKANLAHIQLASQATLYGDREVDIAALQRNAEALVSEGLSAYDNLEIEKAQEKFDAALAIYEQNLGDFDVIKPAARLALLAAGSALVANNDKLARTLIARALLYDPNAQPDPRIYNSAMLATFKDVRAKASKGLKGSLALTTNPAYAELYIDGDFIGMTPDKIDRIDAGPHLIRVVRDGFRASAQVVDVKAGRNETAETLNMVAMPQQMQVQATVEKAAGDLGGLTSPSASALAAKGGATYVVVCQVSVNGDQVKALAGVFHADNRRLGVHERTFSAQAETYQEEARALWDQVQRDIEIALATPEIAKAPSPAKPQKVARALSSKPAVTGLLLAVGGAALATGAVFGVLALVAQGPFRALPQISPDVPAAQADLKLKTLLADTLIFSGAAVATAGILCLVLWDDRPTTKKRLAAPLAFDLSVSPLGALVGAHGTF